MDNVTSHRVDLEIGVNLGTGNKVFLNEYCLNTGIIQMLQWRRGWDYTNVTFSSNKTL